MCQCSWLASFRRAGSDKFDTSLSDPMIHIWTALLQPDLDVGHASNAADTNQQLKTPGVRLRMPPRPPSVAHEPKSCVLRTHPSHRLEGRTYRPKRVIRVVLTGNLIHRQRRLIQYSTDMLKYFPRPTNKPLLPRAAGDTCKAPSSKPSSPAHS